MILGLIISTSLSMIQWNISKSFTLNEHHLWQDRHWQNIYSSKEKTAAKLLKQWLEDTVQVNVRFDAEHNTYWIGTNSHNCKATHQEWQPFEKKALLFPYFK